MTLAGLGALLALGLLACGGDQRRPREAASATSSPSPSPDAAVTVGVSLQISPADADVDLDGESRGPAAALAAVVALEPGVHQVTVRRAGYKTYRAEFIVSDGIEEFVISLEAAR